MLEAGLIGLFSSVIAVALTQLAFRLHRQRQIRIATEIANRVTAKNNGIEDRSLIRQALDARDPSCKLMHVYFNHVRKTDKNEKVQPA